MKRLLTLLIVAGVIAYLVKTYGTSHVVATPGSTTDPVGRARAAARASDAATAATNAAGRESEQAGTGSVSENMTPAQVRSLLGSPDDVSTETLDNGTTRETWTYRAAGKTVVFENGMAVSVR
jgi:hypothetical protein